MHRNLGSRILLGAVVASAALWVPARARDGSDGPPTERLVADLLAKDEHVDVRRDAAKAIRDADPEVKRAALAAMIDVLENEEDGQVRLEILEAVTRMGPDAEPAVPALLHTLRTDYGGRYREETHQDYRSALALAAIGEPAVQGLRSLLDEDQDRESIRAEVVMALGRIGLDAAPAIPDLLPLLGDDSGRIREEVSLALGRIGPAAVEPLVEAAGTGDDRTRAAAIEALAQTAQPDDRTRSAIRKAALDPLPEVRRAALVGLRRDREAVSDDSLVTLLVENLRHEDDAVRRAVIDLLVERPALLRSMASTLEPFLNSEQDGVVRDAAFLLHRLGPEATPRFLDALRVEGTRIDLIAEALARLGRPVAPTLSEALEDPDPRVRRGAALALGRMRPPAPGTVPRLTACLHDPDPEVRIASLTAIGDLGPRAREAVPMVRSLLDDESAEIRLRAVEILVSPARSDDTLLTSLVSRIADADPRVQWTALDALRTLGPRGRIALPDAIEALRGSPPGVRRAAAELVASHGPAAAEAVPVLAEMLAEPDPEARVLAAKTLAELESAAESSLDRLAPLVSDPDPEVRAATASALGSIGPAERVRPWLARALLDEDGEVRRSGRRAVWRLGQDGAILVPDLIRSAAVEEELRSVERSLRRFERAGPDPASIPELVDLLDHEAEAVRLLSVRFLGLAGAESADLVGLLERIQADDPSDRVREEAKSALEQIRG